MAACCARISGRTDWKLLPALYVFIIVGSHGCLLCEDFWENRLETFTSVVCVHHRRKPWLLVVRGFLGEQIGNFYQRCMCSSSSEAMAACCARISGRTDWKLLPALYVFMNQSSLHSVKTVSKKTAPATQVRPNLAAPPVPLKPE